MALLVVNIAVSFPASVFFSYITAKERFLFQRLVSMLRAVLTDETVQGFLRQEGYHLPAERADCTAWLTQLSRRLCCSAEFPHEIGVFLGYPLSDVVGFIENSGRNFTCCGCWKAYGDPQAAQRHFAQLRKCTAVYLRLFHSGTPILRLAVAA